MFRKIIVIALALFLLAGCARVSEEVTSYAGLSNVKQGWGYRPMKGGRPEFTAAQISLADKYKCIYMGPEGDKSIYLTFDEGYENGYTGYILDTLKEYQVPAAFFVTGPYFKSNRDLIDRMVNEGHIVGNHSVNHPSLPGESDKRVETELTDLDRMFFDAYGKSMKYVRPPMGEYSERTLAISTELGYTNVFWSVAYVDWDTKKQLGAENAYQKVMGGLHDGAVILLHAVSKDNSEALERIIKSAREKGYVFKPLTEFNYSIQDGQNG